MKALTKAEETFCRKHNISRAYPLVVLFNPTDRILRTALEIQKKRRDLAIMLPPYVDTPKIKEEI